MTECYDYRTLQLATRHMPDLAAEVHGRLTTQLHDRGSRVYGLFASRIGLASDQALLITAWPDLHTLDAHCQGLVDALAAVASSSGERFVHAVQPRDDMPADHPGVYAHRSFRVSAGDWDEFVACSQAAWPTWHKSFDSHIFGLFKSLDCEKDVQHIRLLTQYTSLAEWERSRIQNLQAEDQRAMAKHFIRRHELTRSTIVIATTLVGPPG